jgi:uncharacterized protein (TIGR03435 family)
MRSPLLPILAVACLFAYSAIPSAQAPARPAFEVATIRLSPPEAQGALMNFPAPGRIAINNFTLRMMISQAYGPELGQGNQIVGGPSWIERDRYVVLGQAQGTPTRPELIAMLKTLLEDRFALKTHTEMKEIDAYALVMARSGGQPGPKLEKWDGTCNGKPAPPAQPNATGPRCAAFFRPPGLVMRGVTMGVLANMLSASFANLGRPVVDRTSLTGEFNFDLETTFAPLNANANDSAPPTVFVALQEQLGLKLEPTRTTVKVLVVDSAERPVEN